jgi:hypothetical protein
MQHAKFESAMARLAKRGARAGISPPEPNENLAEYAARILNALDPENDEHDDVRFVVLAIVNARSS